jgi:hypothetical protein
MAAGDWRLTPLDLAFELLRGCGMILEFEKASVVWQQSPRSEEQVASEALRTNVCILETWRSRVVSVRGAKRPIRVHFEHLSGAIDHLTPIVNLFERTNV